MKKKVCLVGDSRVGKTSILKRYIDDEFLDKYIATISAKIFQKQLQVKIQNNGSTNTVNMLLSIWDLIGHRDQEYWALLKRYYTNTDGVLFVCDLTSIATLENLKDWISSLYNTIGVVPFIIMANKSDIGEQADLIEKNLVEITKQYNSDFFFTSAKTGVNVNLSFHRLCEIMAEQTLRIENMNEPRDVMSEMVAKYCILHGGKELAMPIITHQFKLAGTDMNAPTKQGLLRALERLTQVTQSFKGKDVAKEERAKCLKLIHRLP